MYPSVRHGDDGAAASAFKRLLMNIGDFGSGDFSIDAVRRLNAEISCARKLGT